MKFLIFTISFLVFTLSSTTIHNDDFEMPNNQSILVQQNNCYLELNHKIKSEDIISAGCSACHMKYSLTGESLEKYLEDNFIESTTVHQNNNPAFFPTLIEFLETHNEDEATAKYIDYQELIEFVENQ